MGSTSETASSLARHPALAAAARVGFAVNGVLHILIGTLAILVATGDADENADQSGALAAIAANPAGMALLWVMTVGLAALGLWQMFTAVLVQNHDAKDRWLERIKEGAKGVAYLAVAFTALTFARGSSSDSAEQTETFSAVLLDVPGGVVLLVLVALAVAGVGVYFVVKGAKKKFVDDLIVPSGTVGRVTVAFGIVGYIAKGVALAVVGILFAVAAVNADPSEASGLDGAVQAIAALPFGSGILIAVGAGFVAYGVYCFVRARRAKQ